MVYTSAQEVDNKISDSVRNFLHTDILERFEELEGIDLVARNIQRGRDHRIPLHSNARRALGLSACREILQISSDRSVARALSLAHTLARLIDGFTGALSGDRARGSSFEELLRASRAADFTRLRDRNRFLHLNDAQFSRAERALSTVRLLFNDNVSAIRPAILNNTDITSTQIPSNFLFAN